MAKRRKKRVEIFRPNGTLNPKAKSRIAKIADDLWGWAVREDWAHKCAVCKKAGDQPHHLIPRQWYRYRFDLKNGICLCSWDHLRDPGVAPHANAPGWAYWMEAHHPRQWAWCMARTSKGDHKRFDEIKNLAYYCDVLRDLEQYVSDEDFRRICGVKFSAWLEQQA